MRSTEAPASARMRPAKGAGGACQRLLGRVARKRQGGREHTRCQAGELDDLEARERRRTDHGGGPVAAVPTAAHCLIVGGIA